MTSPPRITYELTGLLCGFAGVAMLCAANGYGWILLAIGIGLVRL